MSDRQVPKQVAQRLKVDAMDWNKANDQWHWADKNLSNDSPYKLMLSDRLAHLESIEDRARVLESISNSSYGL